MVQFQPKQWLLSEEDLPETDNQPVDNELQVTIPTLLRSILGLLWADRTDWYMGINLGLYYDPDQPAIGPDAFLSLGVQRFRPGGKLRLSYVLPQENHVIPQWVLEIVSKTPGNEYGDKLQKYAGIGVRYYTIYNPDYWQRDQHQPFEVYRLEQETYIRLNGNPIWMPELELGIGCEVGCYEGLTRDWLYWYDQNGQRHATPEERREQSESRVKAAQQQIIEERQQRERAEQRAEKLAQRLRELGQNP
jgi:Uma2 family endonuclease